MPERYAKPRRIVLCFLSEHESHISADPDFGTPYEALRMMKRAVATFQADLEANNMMEQEVQVTLEVPTILTGRIGLPD